MNYDPSNVDKMREMANRSKTQSNQKADQLSIDTLIQGAEKLAAGEELGFTRDETLKIIMAQRQGLL